MITETKLPDHMLPVVNAIYRRGQRARSEGDPITANPFLNGDNRRSWELGWKDMGERLKGTPNAGL